MLDSIKKEGMGTDFCQDMSVVLLCWRSASNHVLALAANSGRLTRKREADCSQAMSLGNIALGESDLS